MVSIDFLAHGTSLRIVDRISRKGLSMLVSFLVLVTLATASGHGLSANVFDGYAEYYRTVGSLFQSPASLRITGVQNSVVRWRNQRIRLDEATAFPSEFVVDDDIGPAPVAFEKFPFACIEGQAPSSVALRP